MNEFISLMYHNVVEDAAPNSCLNRAHLGPSVTSYFVSRDDFAAHLDRLCNTASCLDFDTMKQFYGTEPPADLPHTRCKGSKCQNVKMSKSQNEKTAHRPTFRLFDFSTFRPFAPSSFRPFVQFTFDDGWLGSIDVAGPLLESRGCQALMFVTTDLIDKPLFATRQDLQQLPQHTFRIGSHAKTHRMLNRLDEAAIREELETSKNVLEEIAGYEIDSVSIPGGAIDDRVRRIAVEVGYRYVFTSEVHLNSLRAGPLNIGRIAIRQSTSSADIARYSRHQIRKEKFRRRLLGLSKRVLGDGNYAAFRSRVLGEERDHMEMAALSSHNRAMTNVENQMTNAR